MTLQGVTEALTRVGAFIDNSHIIYTSGRHGSQYLNKDAIYPHTELTSDLCELIAEHFRESAVELVLAPALGGIILSQWTAFHLSRKLGREILGIYAEKSEDSPGFVLKRGYENLIRGKSVLVVEDVLTTGGSVKSVVELCKRHGTEVIAIAALCNRGRVNASFLTVPKLFSLLNVNFTSWPAEECPLCENEIPINTSVGKGKPLR